MKYFNNYQSKKELRKEYLTLMKKHHPDYAKDKGDFVERCKICTEINNEYELVSKMFSKSEEQNDDVKKSIYDYVVNGNEEARHACNEVAKNIASLAIDFNFYHVVEGARWWEDEILEEIDNSINLFWVTCSSKKIVGSEFAELFKLCDFNVEKMRRTIMFLSTGAIPEKDIHTNLTSSTPIPFFDNCISIDNLPDYNSFLLLSRENTTQETKDAWIDFCQKQRDFFTEKFYEMVVPKINTEKQR